MQDPEAHGRPSLASKYIGADISLQVAEEALRNNEPVDGILGSKCHSIVCSLACSCGKQILWLIFLAVLLGFSQGAALSSLLLARIQQSNITQQVKFAVLVRL